VLLINNIEVRVVVKENRNPYLGLANQEPPETSETVEVHNQVENEFY
jgi:hypothetical protein